MCRAVMRFGKYRFRLVLRPSSNGNSIPTNCRMMFVYGFVVRFISTKYRFRLNTNPVCGRFVCSSTAGFLRHDTKEMCLRLSFGFLSLSSTYPVRLFGFCLSERGEPLVRPVFYSSTVGLSSGWSIDACEDNITSCKWLEAVSHNFLPLFSKRRFA